MLVASSALTACSGIGTPGGRSGAGGSLAGGGARGSIGATSSPGELDVAAENARSGTASWKIGGSEQGTVDDVGGYTDPVTVASGTTFHLFISTNKTSLRAAAYRMGYYGGAGGRQYWASGPLSAQHQTATTYNSSTRATAAAWRPTATVSTARWPPGFYLIKLSAGRGSGLRSRYVPLLVRSRSTSGRVVLMPSLFTSNAYNTFGGRSAYTGPQGFASRAFAASFNRPNSWKTYGQGTGKFLSYERPLVQLAEKLGLPLAYESDLDISTIPGVLNGSRAVVTLGHAEYWSIPQRNAIESARDHGTNLLFLGANTSYWRVRLTNNNKTMVIYKSTRDPIYPAEATTTLWRSAPHARPERRLTGLAYNCFPASGAFRVTVPSFWGFAGTGVRAGSSFTNIIGPEVDSAIRAADVPSPALVVASSNVSCGGQSSMLYYTTRSGSGVVSTGSMGWILRGFGASAPLATRAFVERVTAKLLQEASRGRLGLLHPLSGH